MEYIGNYSDWIKKEWILELLNNSGTPRPSGGKTPDTKEEKIEYQKAIEAGYSENETYFFMFDKDNFKFNLFPPFVQSNYHWWITKMMPGNFMPMHVDPHTLYEPNSQRYWMPLQDYSPGHIFMYENLVITDYKAGDVYRYKTSSAIHGAANIGHVPRVVLQVSTHE
jgi:hypothetical protein